MTYERIFVGLDGSSDSRFACGAALEIAAGSPGGEIIGCHVHATRLHRTRFGEMEPGLPDRYREEERLASLRSTHEDLIADGMDLISGAYLAPLAAAAARRGVPFDGLAPEGRNWVELLRIIGERRPDLAVLGARGLGAVPETTIGSCAERVLHSAAATDLLLMRRPWGLEDRPIVVGVDGSDTAYLALRRALELARAFGSEVDAVAVYDPYFHTGVFRTIAGILPPEAAERFDFQAQERLHDEIIDQGLETLYRQALERGRPLADDLGITLRTEVVAGKVWPALLHYSALKRAGLIVLGRYGLHREFASIAGGSTLNAARLSTGNLLVVAPPAEPFDLPDASGARVPPLHWSDEAVSILERVPAFARPMARAAIEDRARRKGESGVTGELVREVSCAFRRGTDP
jgi:nucleotide-binding universal stress UspA family protein